MPMKLHPRHRWDVSPAQAIALQRRLREELILDQPIDLGAVKTIAGVDVSVKENQSQAAVVVTSFPEFRVLETSLARLPTPFPYIPGLLSFREGPVLEKAFEQLATEPDVFLFDGMGTAHPRRIGIACHLGLWLERPTIGCGKTRLVGHHEPLAEEKGASAPLIDRGETIGVVVRSQTATSPIYVSPGHRADLHSSASLALACCLKYRLPEPIRLAHNAAGSF